MVTLLYALILIPVALYLIAFCYETFLSIEHVIRADSKKSHLFIQATTEITNTVLVYGFTVFMVTHADLLPSIAVNIFTPIAIFMTALLIRGCLYLFLFYVDETSHAPRRMWHSLFALTYIANLGSLIWTIVVVTQSIFEQHFTPSTDNIPLIAVGGVIALCICIMPIIFVFRQSVRKDL